MRDHVTALLAGPSPQYYLISGGDKPPVIYTGWVKLKNLLKCDTGPGRSVAEKKVDGRVAEEGVALSQRIDVFDNYLVYHVIGKLLLGPRSQKSIHLPFRQEAGGKGRILLG